MHSLYQDNPSEQHISLSSVCALLHQANPCGKALYEAVCPRYLRQACCHGGAPRAKNTMALGGPGSIGARALGEPVPLGALPLGGPCPRGARALVGPEPNGGPCP